MNILNLNEKYVEETRRFMLSVIKGDFGYEYNPHWHSDIDRLHEHYIENGNCHCLVCVLKREIVGTIAARPYDRDYEKFRGRYTPENTLGIWRHYIKKDLRGKGVGTVLLKNLESRVARSEYKYLYLHTQKTIPGSLEYWLAKGYEITWDTKDELKTVHLEKKVWR